MHELSLAMEIVQLLEAHAHQLARITILTLDIGTLSCVDEGALRTALGSALQGTLAQGAQVHIHTIEALAQCQDCQHRFSPPPASTPAPPAARSARPGWPARISDCAASKASRAYPRPDFGLADTLTLLQPPLPAPAQEMAGAIRDQAMRLHSMVSNLLDMARLQSGQQAGQLPLRLEWQPIAACRTLESSAANAPQRPIFYRLLAP